MRILHSCFKAQDNGDTRNHGLYDPSAYAVSISEFIRVLKPISIA